MPMETPFRLTGLTPAPSVPQRILSKGPAYFRRPPTPDHRRLSAVERLQADKAKYVKSREAIGSSSNNNSSCCEAGDNLNLQVLRSLLNGPENPDESAGAQSPNLNPDRQVSPNDPEGAEPGSTAGWRSRSDLSERPGGADLENFFSHCGLDPQELEGVVGMGPALGPGSDVVSLQWRSGSVVSPDRERSLRSEQGLTEDEEEEEEQRVPYGISAVERNARIIKWLYSIRQEGDSQRVSHV